jgi:hypothetical protein
MFGELNILLGGQIQGMRREFWGGNPLESRRFKKTEKGLER